MFFTLKKEKHLVLANQECRFYFTADDDVVRSLASLLGDWSSSHSAPLKVRTLHHVSLGTSALQIAPNVVGCLITWAGMRGSCSGLRLHPGDWWPSSRSTSRSHVSGSSLNRCTSTALRAKLRTDSQDQKKPILLNMNTQPRRKMA